MEANKAPSPQGAPGLVKGQPRIECEHLGHFLGPLALAANNANFEPFNYTLNGVSLRIGKAMVNDLLQAAYAELKIANQIMQQLHDLKLETNGEFSEFLSTPIEDMRMTTRLYHMLCDANCVTMLDVAKLGALGVSHLRYIGPKSVAEARRLFAAAGCPELFDAELK